MSSVADGLAKVQERIVHAAQTNNRPVDDVLLVAVSKKHPAQAIETAYENGQRHFGENYLQEALDKIELLPLPGLVWHFIGPVQSNKTRAIAENFQWVHTIDRLKVAQRLSDQRPDGLPPINVCIQINIDDEESKSGIDQQGIESLALAIDNMPNIALRGLMAIPRKTDTDHGAFIQMRTLFNQLKNTHKFAHFDTLSMGMSGDLEIAVSNGSTIVRIGTDIFGAREK